MDNKPSLSQYFGDKEVPPASQFFDEIGTSPSEMIQSIYLGETEGNVSVAFYEYSIMKLRYFIIDLAKIKVPLCV